MEFIAISSGTLYAIEPLMRELLEFVGKPELATPYMEEMKVQLDNPDYVCIAIANPLKNECIAFGAASVSPTVEGRVLVVYHLYSRVRGKGYGKMIFQVFERVAEEEGCVKMMTSTKEKYAKIAKSFWGSLKDVEIEGVVLSKRVPKRDKGVNENG